jgi:hypothetical protein
VISSRFAYERQEKRKKKKEEEEEEERSYQTDLISMK